MTREGQQQLKESFNSGMTFFKSYYVKILPCKHEHILAKEKNKAKKPNKQHMVTATEEGHVMPAACWPATLV